MELPHVLSCGVYRAAEKFRQHISAKWINFAVSGQHTARIFSPDGTSAGECPPVPFLSFGFPGFVTDFEYRNGRENFVLFLEMDSFQYDEVRHQLYLQNGGRREYLTMFCKLAEEDVPSLRDLFIRISRLAKSGISSDNLRADILTAGLFNYFLKEELPPDSPAVILKKRIDDDRAYQYSLQDHARAIGLSSDHLRREFQAQFGISPGEYRERQRRNDLLARITYTCDSFKEIAASLGLKHVQHLNLLTKKYFQCTPKELAERFRRQTAYVSANDAAKSKSR